MQRRAPRPARAGLKASPPLVADGQWVEIAAQVENPTLVRRMIANVRRSGDQRFRRLLMKREGADTWRVRVVQSGDVEYFIEADGAEHALVGRAGRPDRPLTVKVGGSAESAALMYIDEIAEVQQFVEWLEWTADSQRARPADLEVSAS